MACVGCWLRSTISERNTGRSDEEIQTNAPCDYLSFSLYARRDFWSVPHLS